MSTQTTHDFVLSAAVSVEATPTAGAPSSEPSVDMKFAGALTFSDDGSCSSATTTTERSTPSRFRERSTLARRSHARSATSMRRSPNSSAFVWVRWRSTTWRSTRSRRRSTSRSPDRELRLTARDREDLGRSRHQLARHVLACVPEAAPDRVPRGRHEVPGARIGARAPPSERHGKGRHLDSVARDHGPGVLRG